MNQEELKVKMVPMMGPCACGSGKPGWQCCMKGEARAIENETCICGSGKKVKDCCMKSPDTHKEI